MLKMLQCDKFIENGKVRPSIVFKRGLNTILGDEFGSNSIGKSTFLMCIDFAFGGDDYVRRLIDTQENIGSHTVNFTFEFEDGLHHFSRTTDNIMKVNICDENYQPKRTLSKEAYTKFLSKKYKLNLPGLTLRSAISRFFRVYGRETLDPKYPLQTAIRESGKSCIESLLKIFNSYKEIEKQKELTERAKLEEDTFKNAQKYNYLPSVTTKVKYEENEKRISELELFIQDLINESTEGFADVGIIQTRDLSEIKQKLSVAKRHYVELANELTFIEQDSKRQTIQKDYHRLQKFFPEMNVKSLEEVDAFHKQLSSLLKEETKKKTAHLQEMINLAAEQIACLEAQLTEIGLSPNVTHAVLTQYCQKQKELDQLREANQTYETKARLTKKTKELTILLDQLVLEVIAHTETCINVVMEKVNEQIYNSKRSAPQLLIKDASHYTFSTPNDRGTGSQYKGLIVFDLATLKMTNLPLLAHDSVLLKQIEDGALEEILKLYTETDKQIFVVLDKKSSLTTKAQEILQENKILHLYPNGGELFGYAWNK